MNPGSIVLTANKKLLFLILQPILKDTKSRVPITVLEVEPFILENVLTQVYADKRMYYLVPGAGWLLQESIHALTLVDKLHDKEQLLAISANNLILQQLQELL